jgi:hypothetical protein
MVACIGMKRFTSHRTDNHELNQWHDFDLSFFARQRPSFAVGCCPELLGRIVSAGTSAAHTDEECQCGWVCSFRCEWLVSHPQR